MSSLRDDLILAYPSKKIGFVEVITDMNNEKKKIEAHKSPLCALKLCPNGYKMATASEKGTLIRIFDILKCECIQELRRGSEYATIYSIAFDIKSKWLACSSDSGTIHIFALKPTEEEVRRT
jgi:WD40 repeat protein